MAKIQKSNEQNMIDGDNRDKYVNGRPVFNAENWEGVCRYANCYAYAMNVTTVKENIHLSQEWSVIKTLTMGSILSKN